MDWPEQVQVFRVGGAVRDRLLGITPRENDYVVVGASPELMSERGFRAVGKDFPVFLHPETNEEYALARTERKQGHGYKGFQFHAEPDVTLQQDLERRDLTVNAIAEDEDGNLVDPFNGVGDLEHRVLRHVSAAFVEDPLRVLRVAKFAARLHRFSFTIADETMHLMRELVESGELEHLVAERVWQETRAALLCPAPQEFFRVLRECGALEVLFPELDALFGVPQPEKWHPEIDTGVHQLLVLEQVARLTDSLPARYAALVHDLGKGTTPPAEWPSHRGHEERGVKLVKAFSNRLKVPRDCMEAGVNVSKFHTHVHRAQELRADTMMRVIEGVGGIKEPQRMEDFLHACEADARGRTGLEDQPYPQADRFRRALDAAKSISADDVDIEGLEGAAIGEKIRKARIAAIRQALRELDKGID